jgi:predicted phage tail protein
MKKFILHGEMADLFTPEVNLDVSTPHEAIHALCCNFKGFRPYIVSKTLAGVNYQFVDSQKNTYDHYCGHIILKNDQYELMAAPEGYGAIMAAGNSLLGTPIGAGIANFAMGYAMQKLTAKFTEGMIQDDGKPEYEIIQTNSFIYTQNENKTEQGSPIPVIYGQLRVGTKVINSSVENYDYNFENAYIYPNPPDANQVDMIHGGQFSFVLPIDYDDYRDNTDLDAFNSYNPSGKRSLSFAADGSKNFDPESNNESQAEGYDLGGNEYGASEIKKYGPSSRGELKKSSGTVGYSESSTPRPYVYPTSGKLDFLMRPSTRNDLCVERVQKSGQASNECLAWVGSNSEIDQMIIKDRGDYQKLESIGLYKSLEVLSEGPIAGLALPISSDIDRDNGPITYPLSVDDLSNSSNTIKLGSLKYNASTNPEIVDQETSTLDITILNSGVNYKDSSGNLLSGSYIITPNDTSTADNTLTVRFDKPGLNYAAKIGDTKFARSEFDYFSSDTESEEPYYLSNNHIFIINPEDGTVKPNDEASPFALNSVYYNSNGSFSLVNLEAQPPDSHPDGSIELDFFAGENYPNKNFEYEIHPASKHVEFQLTKLRSDHVPVYHSKAQCVDLGSLLGYDIQTQTVQPFYQEIERQTNAGDDEIPSFLDENGDRYKWSDMCRIYLHQAGINSITSDLSVLNETHYIPVGYAQRKDNLPFNSNTYTNIDNFSESSIVFGVNKPSSYFVRTTNEQHLTKIDLYVPLTASEYFSMQKVPEEWIGFENWYFKDGNNYYPFSEWKQFHEVNNGINGNYPTWSNTVTYAKGDVVSHKGGVFKTTKYIEGDPDLTQLSTWLPHYDYPAGSEIKYGGKAYRAKNLIRGIPNSEIVNEVNSKFNRFNSYITYTPVGGSSGPAEPAPSNYNSSNTVIFENKYYHRSFSAYLPDPHPLVQFNPSTALPAGSAVGSGINYFYDGSYSIDDAYTGTIYQSQSYIEPVYDFKSSIVQDWLPTESYYSGDFVRFFSWDQSKSVRYDYLNSRNVEQSLRVKEFQLGVNLVDRYRIYDRFGNLVQTQPYYFAQTENVYELKSDYIAPPEWDSGREYADDSIVYIYDETVVTTPSDRNDFQTLQFDKEQQIDPYSFWQYTGTGENWDVSPADDTENNWEELSTSYLDSISPSGLRYTESASGNSSFSLHNGYIYPDGFTSEGSKVRFIDQSHKPPFYHPIWNSNDEPYDTEYWEEYLYMNPRDNEETMVNNLPHNQKITHREKYGYWTEIAISSNNTPDQDTANWENLPIDNVAPPIRSTNSDGSFLQWNPYDGFSSGDCLVYEDEFYTATGDISGFLNPDVLPIWDANSDYGGDDNPSSVQHDGDAYKLRIDPSTNTQYEIETVSETDYLTDEQVSGLYYSDTNFYSYLLIDEGTDWQSVPCTGCDPSATGIEEIEAQIDWNQNITYLINDAPNIDTSRWELQGQNDPPGQDPLWRSSEDFEPFAEGTEENFDKTYYNVFCTYQNREGIIQNPDPRNNSGGLMSSLTGDKIYFTRQSTKSSHIQMISRDSTAWTRLIAGDVRNMNLADLLVERYEKAEDGGPYHAMYEQKYKKNFKKRMRHFSAEGTQLFYSQGHDFNEKIISILKSAGVINDGHLSEREDTFYNSRQRGGLSMGWRKVSTGTFSYEIKSSPNAASQLVIDRDHKTSRIRHLKFSIGYGNNNMYLDSEFMLNDSFPGYMLQRALNKLSGVKMLKKGYNSKDDTDYPYGFYESDLGSGNPHYPRVTVFIMRKRFNNTIDFCPTLYQVVAKVNAKEGVIENVYLINDPIFPVYDSALAGQDSDGFTNIYPQDITYPKPSYVAGDERFQDIGVYLRIDGSHGYHNVRLNIENGSIDQDIQSPDQGEFGLNESWRSHIAFDGVFVSPGIEKAICRNNQTITVDQFGNQSAELTVSTETALAIPKGNNLISDGDLINASVVDTGRVKSFLVSSVGANYSGRSGVEAYIFNQKFIVKTMKSISKEAGYKPSVDLFSQYSFVVYGLPKSIFDDTTIPASSISRYVKFKARIFVNQFGRIQTKEDGSLPVKIIDTGYTLADENDSIIFLDVAYNEALDPFFNSQRLQDIINEVSTDSNGFTPIGLTNQSSHLMPDYQRPKLPIIIRAEGSNDKLDNFKIIQNGRGFNLYDTIKDPFLQISFNPPKVELDFLEGKLQNAQLLPFGSNESNDTGYSQSDVNIKITVSKPFVPYDGQYPPDQLSSNGQIVDPHAKFRSIYLNDVPIRDHTGRFNYSKFHFDMRIGHQKNPFNQHIIKGQIAPKALDQLISEEFRVPTHTKFINYPLFGPRNEGEKDYYYSHTIKNPAVSDISFSIKINQLHYIYEGDESAVYLNLLPILGMVLGYMIGKWAAEKLLNLIPEFTVSFGVGTSTGWSIPSISQAKELLYQAAAWAAIQTAGIVAAMLVFDWINDVFKCSDAPWLCIKLGEVIKNSGEIWPAQIRIQIEHGIEGEELTTDTIAIRGCSTSPYVKDIFLNNLPNPSRVAGGSQVKKNRIFRIYRLTRELDPVTGGLAEARYKIDAELLAATEYIGGYFSYPNTAIVGTRFNSKDHPSLPRREYIIKGRLIRIPSNYDPVTGNTFHLNSQEEKVIDDGYVTVWDGQFDPELQWTSNPAWIIYDLLTNNRYGMGKYGIKDEDLDKWSFYQFAKRCDEKVNAVIESSSIEERRHMCNVYIDSERQAYDYVRELMDVYNTKINFTGGTIHIVADAPSENGPIMLFNNSNISENGFAYSSTPETDRLTAATVDFLDERDNYMRKTEYVEDAEGVREHGYKHVRIAGIGITRRGEAHRLAWHKILTKQMEKEIIVFNTGIRASYLRIGDVIEVMDNNKVSEHSGGRIAKIINSNTVELDIPVAALGNSSSLYIESPVQVYDEWQADSSFPLDTTVIYAGHFYKNITGSNGDTPPDEDETNWDNVETIRQKQFKEYAISSKSNFNVTFTTSIDVDIKEGFTWIVKENSQDKSRPKQYKIKQVKEVSALNYEVVASEHFEDKYNQIDNSTGSQEGIEFESREYYGPPISTA